MAIRHIQRQLTANSHYFSKNDHALLQQALQANAIKVAEQWSPCGSNYSGPAYGISVNRDVRTGLYDCCDDFREDLQIGS